MDGSQRYLLLQYADSFIRFVVRTLIGDASLKLIRIGIGLLEFVVNDVDDLERRTNVPNLLLNLVELFNDGQGAGIVRLELMQLFCALSYKVSIKMTLSKILQGVFTTESSGKSFLLRTYIMVCLLQGQGVHPQFSVFEEKAFLLAQVAALATAIPKKFPFMQNLASEALVALS